MKNKTKILLAGAAILLTGMGLFAIFKTKKLSIQWDLEDKDFGEDLCQNCNC